MIRAQLSAGADSEWQMRHQQTCETSELCRGGEGVVLRTTETRHQRTSNELRVEWIDGVPKSEDAEGDEIDCHAGPAKWKVRIGPRNSPTQKEREEPEAEDERITTPPKLEVNTMRCNERGRHQNIMGSDLGSIDRVVKFIDSLSYHEITLKSDTEPATNAFRNRALKNAKLRSHQKMQ